MALARFTALAKAQAVERMPADRRTATLGRDAFTLPNAITLGELRLLRDPVLAGSNED